MRRSVIVCLLFAAPLRAMAQSLSALSDRDAAGGLKEALIQGVGKAVATLGQPDGFFSNPKVKIPLPPALGQAERLMRAAGMGRQADDLIAAMNRAAETAVPEAKGLLIDAVKGMSVDDAKRIVSGGEDSVTQYFRGKTSAALTQRFLPIVRAATQKVDVARKYDQLAGQAAQFGLLGQEDAKVETYVTRKTLDGLFFMLAEEERAIRRDPLRAAGSLARKVFGAK